MPLPSPVNPVTAFVGGHLALNITSATTNVVKAAPGVLVRIIINKAVASEVITIYDNATVASGTKLATVTLPGTLLLSQDWLEYGIGFSNGLVVVTAQASDITVVYT